MLLVLLVTVVLVMLLVLLVVGGVMSVMLVMGRRHHRLHQGGRQGERGQGSEQVANPHVGVSFLMKETPGGGGRLKEALPACPECRWGLPGPAPESLSERPGIGESDLSRHLRQIELLPEQPLRQHASNLVHHVAEQAPLGARRRARVLPLMPSDLAKVSRSVRLPRARAPSTAVARRTVMGAARVGGSLREPGRQGLGGLRIRRAQRAREVPAADQYPLLVLPETHRAAEHALVFRGGAAAVDARSAMCRPRDTSRAIASARPRIRVSSSRPSGTRSCRARGSTRAAAHNAAGSRPTAASSERNTRKAPPSDIG